MPAQEARGGGALVVLPHQVARVRERGHELVVPAQVVEDHGHGGVDFADALVERGARVEATRNLFGRHVRGHVLELRDHEAEAPATQQLQALLRGHRPYHAVQLLDRPAQGVYLIVGVEPQDVEARTDLSGHGHPSSNV